MLLQPVSIPEIRSAHQRIADVALRTPLIQLPTDIGRGGTQIFLKLENLQPIGSFKIRGAANAMAMHRDRITSGGVYTASAGNMAQGVAWCARELDVPCTVIVPDQAPQTKLDAIERLGGTVIKRSFDEWWKVIVNHGDPEMNGLFIHPFADPAVMAGNGTIGLEILEDLTDVDAILVPYGGGGLSCGIASAVKSLSPRTRVYAVEVETAAPLSASLHAGTLTHVDYTRTFIDGMGSAAVSEEMWPLAQSLLAGSIVVSVAQIAAAVKLLAERCRVIAEGAGAASVAAATQELSDAKRIVCIISGGNIDSAKLAAILGGAIP